MNIFCAILALAGLAVAAWVVLTGQIQKQGLDALFLILVSLLIALLFSIMPLQALRARRRARPDKKDSTNAKAA